MMSRVSSLLATAFEQPFEPFVLAKIGRACELWNEGEKALAHIHLAHAGLPPCDEARALRLFVADELLESGATPAALMKAQGFEAAPLPLVKFPGQPRVPAGNGRESGRTEARKGSTTTSFSSQADRTTMIKNVATKSSGRKVESRQSKTLITAMASRSIPKAL
jgi:hypothetical protein